MKIRPSEAELFHADGEAVREREDRPSDRWTDSHDKASSRFSQFCKPAWKLFETKRSVSRRNS